MPGPGVSPGPFFNVAQTLQSALEAAFTTAGVLPARHYVSNGSVAMDLDDRPGELDEMLVVEVENIRTGFAGTPVVAPIDPATLFVLDIAIYAIRVAPVLDIKGRAPLIASVVTSAREVLYDQWLVGQTILAGIQGRTLFPPDTKVHWGEARPYGPRGGVVGTVTRVTVSMT